MDLQSEIKAAIAKHGSWKSNLRSAIEKGSSEFSAATVRRDDQCAFGKWLISLDSAVKNTDHYRKCNELHRQFHQATASVLNLAVTGKKDEATQALDTRSEFAKVSASLTNAMMSWANAVK